MPIIVFDNEPLSIVEPHPISQFSFIITIPMWGYLIFFSWFGKNPKPFFNRKHIFEFKNLTKTVETKNLRRIVKILKELAVFNTSLSEDNKFLIQKKYFNIAVAVNTDRGLVVTVIKNANKKL